MRFLVYSCHIILEIGNIQVLIIIFHLFFLFEGGLGFFLINFMIFTLIELIQDFQTLDRF